MSPEAEKQYREALELEAAGRHEEARIAVEQAIAAGAGRDAQLLAAKLAILREDLDAATRLARAARAKPAATRWSSTTSASWRRSAASTTTPAAATGRPQGRSELQPGPLNLAVLTWEARVKDEAQHHARKFIDAVPGDDPNAAKLQQMMGGVLPASASPGAQP